MKHNKKKILVKSSLFDEVLPEVLTASAFLLIPDLKELVPIVLTLLLSSFRCQSWSATVLDFNKVDFN